MSYHIQNFDLVGIFSDIKVDKKTNFISYYYKMVSVILKNKYVKESKKKVFEQVISQNITEKTVNLLMANFTKTRNNVDPKSKILLKAIAKSKFQFFETFAMNFQQAIYDLISNSSEKNYLNKYVFKIIEKCITKFVNVEKEFLNKLYKIAYNIINMFLSTENSKIRKIFRSSVKIVYSIYQKHNYSNTKIIKFFQKILFSVMKFSDETIKGKEIRKILADFVEVNIIIHKKKGDLSEFYDLFYSLILNLDEYKNNFLLPSFVDRYSENILSCIKDLFKYEISLGKDKVNDLSYTRLLNSLFDLFYSDKATQNRKTNCIKIICCIIENCDNKTKVSILEKISFSHLSFFMDSSNSEYLKILLETINQYVNIPEIYEVFIRYLDILLHICLKDDAKMQFFIEFIEKKVYNRVRKYQLFYLFVKFSNRFISNLYENNSGTLIIASGQKLKILNFFLRTLAKCSCELPNFIEDYLVLQEILNIYISFLSIKILNFRDIDYSSKYKLKPMEDVSEFSIYLLILAQNLPCMIFNRNSSLTNPIKIEINLNLTSLVSDRKILSEDFKEFNEIIKKQNKEMELNSYIYLLGIYICFLARYVILNIFFTEGASQQKDILKTKIYIESLITEKASIINMIEYCKDNFFLYDNAMYENFLRIFDFFCEKYLDIMMKYYNTRYKQILLSNDLICLLNNSCFYHEKVRNISLDLIKTYSDNFPFILNEYDIFEYYVNVLGKLILQSVNPYDYFIKVVRLDELRGHCLELSSEQETNSVILSKLSDFFEKCLQKSHIINNNNIIYNISNYINKYSLNTLGNQNKDEMNYSINILQKIYNKIKKVEIASFLKTSAYLDPKKFETYLKENVYNNFDKYISISAVDDIHNLTDYAKSIILQVRNKFMGIIEGKLNNLKVNYLNDNLFEFYKKLIIGKTNKVNEIFISSFSYYKIMNDINNKLQDIFSRNDDIKTTTDNIFPILIELTSFIVYSGINEFKTVFNKNILLDEIINVITFIPILLGNSSAIETGTFCWEWILYFKKNNLASLMNNIILYVKCLRQYIDLYNNNYINKINSDLKSTNLNKQNPQSQSNTSGNIITRNTISSNLPFTGNYSNPINNNILQSNGYNTSNIFYNNNIKNNFLNNQSFLDINNNNNFNINGTEDHKNIYMNFDMKNIKTKSDIFDISNSLGEKIIKNYINYENFTLDELNKKNANFFSNHLGKNKFRFISENFFVIVKEKIIKNFDLNDYLNSQIILLKFIKECMNEFCKSDIEKLYLIYDFMKIYVDLKIDINLYYQPLYIYLHFLIFNISLELIDIIQDKLSIYQIKPDELSDFIILTFLYGFRYFEFEKQRRTIINKILLSEAEQTLINCVEIIIRERKKTKLLKKKLRRNNTKKNYKKIDEFAVSLSSISDNLNKADGMEISENIKELLVYLIESELNNLRYWNSPSTFHNTKKKYILNSSKLKEDKLKELFESASSISNKLTIQLTQRFPWIERKFIKYMDKLGNCIYANKNKFYNQSIALKYLIDYIFRTKFDELNNLKLMKHFILWKYPSLNFALKYISYQYSDLKGLHRYCMHMLENAKNNAIIFYMPQLIQSFRTRTDYNVEKFVIKKSKESPGIAHQFLWSLEVEEIMGPKAKHRYLPKNMIDKVYGTAKILRLKISKNFNPMQRKFWNDENLLFSKINEISGKFLHLDENLNLSLKMDKGEKTKFVREELAKLPKKIPNHIYLPTNPNLKITEILPNTASSLQSAKKVPFIVSFIGREYEGPDSEYLIKHMNYCEYIKNEIYDFKMDLINQSNAIQNANNLRNTINIGNSASNNNNVMNLENFNSKNYMNKSTANTNFNYGNLTDNENQLRLNTNLTHDESIYFNYQRNSVQPNDEEDLIIYDEQDNFSELNVPHLDIKIFGKPEDKDETNNLNIEVRNNEIIDLDNLSNCTDTSEIENDAQIYNRIESFNKMNNNNLLTIYQKQNLLKGNLIINNNILKNPNGIGSIPNDEVETTKFSCIFKVGDDLRQDSLALQVISIFQEIFKQNNLNLFLYPYQTISTISSKHKDLGGFIECCPDCDSRDQIGKTFDTNLYDYFVCTFGQENSEEYRAARKNLIQSLAAYAIVSYILQIKDRHNGNILVDKYGHLIHIDFGFIFDISPAGNIKFEKAAFKLTKEMIRIMDSIDSEPYQIFVDLCIRAFLASRDYVDKLLDPVVLMFNSGLDCFRENSIKNFLERFRLDLTEDEAAIYFRELIKEAEDNWRTNFYDYIQSKQNKIHY